MSEPTFDLDISWTDALPKQQAILLYFALHHYQAQVEQGNPLGAAWLLQFPAAWLFELRARLSAGQHTHALVGDNEEILSEVDRLATEAENLQRQPINAQTVEALQARHRTVLESAKSLGDNLLPGLQIGKYLEFQVTDGAAVYLIDGIEDLRVHCRFIPYLDADEASAVDRNGWCLRSIAEEQIIRREREG